MLSDGLPLKEALDNLFSPPVFVPRCEQCVHSQPSWAERWTGLPCWRKPAASPVGYSERQSKLGFPRYWSHSPARVSDSRVAPSLPAEHTIPSTDATRSSSLYLWAVPGLLVYWSRCWSCDRKELSARLLPSSYWWRGVVGNAFRLKQSYSMPGLVSTAMGDCLRAFAHPVSISSNFLLFPLIN